MGSTVRIGPFDDTRVALYFDCRTTLVEQFRSMFGETLSYSRNRALIFDTSNSLPELEVEQCVRMALRYHLDRKRSRAR